MSRRNKRKQLQHFGDDDDDDDEQGGDDGVDLLDQDDDDDDDDQYGSGGGGFNLSQSFVPEPSQSVKEVKPKERENLKNLKKEDRDRKLSSLSRLILFKALEREPIERLKALKDSGIDPKDYMSGAALEEAGERLRVVFGFELNRIPTWMERQKDLPSKFKDRHYVLNSCMDTPTGDLSRAIHSAHVGPSIERGFLLVVLGLIFCKGQSRSNGPRKALERDLYRLLNRLDDNIPEDPPSQGTGRAKKSGQYRAGDLTESRSTPNVDALLDLFVHWDYLIREKASEDNCVFQNLEEGDVIYSIGPRSAMEIGMKQIIAFCAEVLDQEPDPSMIKEVEEQMADDEDEDDEGEDDGYMEEA
mmetsp:Transcript_60488/g.148407  ORF Transcript_60488/g.148407 Transcript_60488/m.148407 type:complete len:358 (-) Transcript_60488:159-1232(-)